MTDPCSPPGNVEQNIADDAKQPARVQATSAHVVSPNSSGKPADTAAATWLQLIDRYFQVNRRPMDQPVRNKRTII